MIEKAIYIREKLGFTRLQLANIIEVRESTLRSWECGFRSPTIDKAYKWLDVLRIKDKSITLEDIYPRSE